MQFKISKELLAQIEQLIHQKNDQELIALLNEMHHADIAEIFDEQKRKLIFKGKRFETREPVRDLHEGRCNGIGHELSRDLTDVVGYSVQHLVLVEPESAPGAN